MYRRMWTCGIPLARPVAIAAPVPTITALLVPKVWSRWIMSALPPTPGLWRQRASSISDRGRGGHHRRQVVAAAVGGHAEAAALLELLQRLGHARPERGAAALQEPLLLRHAGVDEREPVGRREVGERDVERGLERRPDHLHPLGGGGNTALDAPLDEERTGGRTGGIRPVAFGRDEGSVEVEDDRVEGEGTHGA